MREIRRTRRGATDRLALSSSLALLVAVGCGGPEPVWESAFDASRQGGMFGVWGSAPDDVFMVGGTEDDARIWHFDGADWARMDTPEVPALIWVYGFGADDVYSVGLGGTVLHYDGEEWTQLPTGTGLDLWGAFGFSSNDLWIVGGDPFGTAPLVVHYDGTEFRAVEVSQSENLRDARALFKIWGVDGELFAVGQNGQVLQYDGEIWRNSPAGAAADEDFVSLWGADREHITLVGGRTEGRIARFDGETWRTRAVPNVPGLSGVHVTEAGRTVVTGQEGFVGSYDWERDALTPERQDVTTFEVHAVWGDGEGKTYAAAGDFFPPFAGAALVRTAPAE